MKLKPVGNYTGAKYPCMADYLRHCKNIGRWSGLGMAIALAMWSALLGGCKSIS